MQEASADDAHANAGLKVCLTDTTGDPAILGRLRSTFASLALSEGDLSTYPDAVIVAVDSSTGLTPEVREALAVSRMAGARHAVLLVSKLNALHSAALEHIQDALADFSSKLEMESAVALPVTAEADGMAQLRAHLAALDTGPASVVDAAEPQESGQFAAHIACVSSQDLLPGREYRLRIDGHDLTATLTALKYRLDIDSLRRVPSRTLARGQIGACTIATDIPVRLGESAAGTTAARFTLSDLQTDELVAAGSLEFALRRGVNVHWQPFAVTKELRAAAKEQRPCIIWFTGLSGSGKSTIANLVEGWLALHGRHTYLLDGDNMRHGLNKDLGFTAADRVENIRRVGEVARLFVDAGMIVLCSFISPFRAERESVRALVGADEFIEVHVTAPLAVCEQRDPKGLYAKCRAGHLPNFTGIDSPYEAPEQPDLVLDTTTASAAELAQRVVAVLQERGMVSSPESHQRAMHGH